ncbi:hypothetical protein JXA34_02430 [Patescibacteria group bacterium]|nr:hypothetical protein [Patescibacteria group bacterium]
MHKTAKFTLIIIGILLFMNGVLNIIDDAVVLTYDIASILSGIGFIIVGLSMKE